jgi:hypothetical protein
VAGTADDDVPQRATATGYDGGRAGGSRAAVPSPLVGDDEDERTVQKRLGAELGSGPTNLPAPAAPPVRQPPPVGVGGPRTLPRRPTVVGLAPPPATRADPKPAPPPGSLPKSSRPDDGTLTAVPSTNVGYSGALPLTVPNNVQIREVNVPDEPLEETEVRTLVNSPEEVPTVTGELSIPIPSGRASALPGNLPTLVADDTSAEDAYGAEESVTSREAATSYDDQSITTLAPTSPRTARLGDSGSNAPAPPKERVDTDEAESVTKRAPGHLTNMLRVIASPDEIPPDNQTEVMPNAPVQRSNPAQRGESAWGARGAPPLERERFEEAESGLQMVIPDGSAAERASVGALIAGTPAALPMNAPPMMADVQGIDGARVSFPSAEAFHVASPLQPSPSGQFEGGDPSAPVKKPRYGLLVGLVAGLSLTIPLVLYLLLQSASDEIVRRPVTEVVPDLTKRADVQRTKATRPTPPPVTRPTPKFPRRR